MNSQLPEPTSRQSRRLDALQSLRFVAALMVILAHSSNSVHMQRRALGLDSPFLVGLERFLAAGVDIFFVISGFIMVYVAGDKFGKPNAARDFLARRALRVYPLYFVFTAVTLVTMGLRLYFSGEIYTGYTLELDPSWITGSFFLIPMYKPGLIDIGPVLGPGWTLIYELYFYAGFALLLLFARKKMLPYLGTACGLLLMVHLALPGRASADPPSAPVFMLTHPIVWEFFFGCLIGMVHRSRTLSFSMSAILFVFGWALMLAFAGSAMADGKFTLMRPLYFGVPAAMIVAATVFGESRVGDKIPRVFVALGDSSYSAYLSHAAFTIKAVGLAFMAIRLHRYVPADVLVVVEVGICVALGHAVYVLLERPMNQWSSRFYAGRVALIAKPACE